jgi:hypothetical protein
LHEADLTQQFGSETPLPAENRLFLQIVEVRHECPQLLRRQCVDAFFRSHRPVSLRWRQTKFLTQHRSLHIEIGSQRPQIRIERSDVHHASIAPNGIQLLVTQIADSGIVSILLVMCAGTELCLDSDPVQAVQKDPQ